MNVCVCVWMWWRSIDRCYNLIWYRCALAMTECKLWVQYANAENLQNYLQVFLFLFLSSSFYIRIKMRTIFYKWKSNQRKEEKEENHVCRSSIRHQKKKQQNKNSTIAIWFLVFVMIFFSLVRGLCNVFYEQRHRNLAKNSVWSSTSSRICILLHTWIKPFWKNFHSTRKKGRNVFLFFELYLCFSDPTTFIFFRLQNLIIQIEIQCFILISFTKLFWFFLFIFTVLKHSQIFPFYFIFVTEKEIEKTTALHKIDSTTFGPNTPTNIFFVIFMLKIVS